MKLAYLRDFIAVADTGSLRAAARKLNLSQPSLSKSIQQLEKELDVQLFHRLARGTSLTNAGVAFLARARTVANELRRGQDEVRQLGGGSGGSLSFGISASASLLLLADALQDFRKRYAEVDVRIVGGVFSIMFPELRDGLLDFSISPRPAASIGKEFLIEELFKYEQVVVARRGHPLAAATTLADLLDEKWLVGGATGVDLSDHIDIFRGHGLEPPSLVTRCEYVPAFLSLLISSNMVMMLPRLWVDSPVLSGGLIRVPVRETLATADICIIRRQGLELTPAAEHMLTHMRRGAESYVRSAAADPSR